MKEPDRNILFYYADVSPLDSEELYRAAYAACSADRRQKTDRYVFRKDRNCSLGAEILLRKALNDFGMDCRELSFTCGQIGKPYLSGKSMPYFNLSHSGSYVLCAVGMNETGCDLEQIRNIDLSIAERFFCPGEYRSISAQPTEELRREMFYRFWTLKESFMKATGIGMKLPLDQFEISFGKTGICVTQTADGRVFSFAEFSDIPGYRAALCIAGNSCCTELREILIADCL